MENTILTVVGARPQFIKAAMVSKAFAACTDTDAAKELIIHTGQHYDYDMSSRHFQQLDLPEPILNLGIHDQDRAVMVGRMIADLDKQIKKLSPKMVLVYGDTDSTVAGSIAASFNGVPIAHVEAGPRAFKKMQVEEINRVLVDHMATLNFCPTQHTKANLYAENIKAGVHLVGDVMLDAFETFSNSAIAPSIPKPFVLATLHRRENIDDEARLRAAMNALSQIEMTVFFPAHPRTRARIESVGVPVADNIHLTGPISYFESLGVIGACDFVITDSGGLPKEAYFAGKRSLILNDFASWPELIDAGASRLTGLDSDKVLDALPWARQGASYREDNLFGDAKSSQKIVDHINAFINSESSL